MARFVKLVAIFIISLFVEFNQGSDIDLQLNQQIEFGSFYKKNLAGCKEVSKSVKKTIGSIQSEIQSIDDRLSEKDAQIKKLNSHCNIYSRRITAGSCMGKLTGNYDIQIPKLLPTNVSCDSNMVGPGWTVIQRRVSGRVNFDRNWKDFKAGFGDLGDSFFIGLENLYLLTNWVPHELYILMKTFKGQTIYARYSHFVIGPEDTSYKLLSLGQFSGNCEDSLRNHLNMGFYTEDRDNSGRCAEYWHSGWWYSPQCFTCYLNGRYNQKWINSGIRWYSRDEKLHINFVQMMIKPASE